MQRAQAVSSEGRYLYIYDAAHDITPDDYNEVRHAGVTMALFQAAGRDGDLEALAAADRAVEWMTAHLYRRDGWAALTDEAGARAKVGSTALMVVALAERRLATGDTRHDALMRELGAFLAAMQRPDGGFLVAWEIAAGEPDRVGTSRYYPGEALWALALLHEAFPGEGWDEHARAASIFITTRRDEVEGVLFRPLPDHWAAYGLAEMAEWGLSEPEIEYARRLAGRFGLLIRVETQRQHGLFGGPGRLFRDEVPASAFGTWIEGMSALWRLSTRRRADGGPAPRDRGAAGDRRGPAGAAADRRGRGAGLREPRPRARRLAERRPDAHGRPAARALRAALRLGRDRGPQQPLARRAAPRAGAVIETQCIPSPLEGEG